MQVNIYEAKTRLSSLVDEAAAGEEIVIAKNGKPTLPVLSGNMSFKKETNLSDLIGPIGQTSNLAAPGKNISQWMVYTDPKTGAKIGVVTAVTPLLPTISSPGNSRLLTADINAVAARLQKQINELKEIINGLTK